MEIKKLVHLINSKCPRGGGGYKTIRKVCLVLTSHEYAAVLNMYTIFCECEQ